MVSAMDGAHGLQAWRARESGSVEQDVGLFQLIFVIFFTRSAKTSLQNSALDK